MRIYTQYGDMWYWNTGAWHWMLLTGFFSSDQGAIFLFFAGRTEEIKGNIDEVCFGKCVKWFIGSKWTMRGACYHGNISAVFSSWHTQDQRLVLIFDMHHSWNAASLLCYAAICCNLTLLPGGGTLWRRLQGPADMEAVPPHVLLGADVVLHL